MTDKKPTKEKRSQKERFIETAKEIEADETGKSFAIAFSKIVPPKHKIKKVARD